MMGEIRNIEITATEKKIEDKKGGRERNTDNE